MKISGAAMVAGVVGRPIKQSLSPLIHNAWIAAAGLDAAYVPFELADAGFERFVEGLRDTNLRGLNVTTPFKSRALDVADVLHESARAAGACNLLVYRDDDVIEARNTDGVGLLEAIARQAPSLKVEGARVLLLGAGGAARGAAAALLGANVERLAIVNRTAAKAEALARTLGGEVAAAGWDALDRELWSADLVINATSAELGGGSALPIDWNSAPTGGVAMDMLYRPLETGFLAAARARGLAIVDGLEMLIGQARPTFEALYRQPPPETVDVRALALAAMGSA